MSPHQIPLPPYVCLVQGRVEVSNYDTVETELKQLGFKTDLAAGVMRKDTATHEETAVIFAQLNALHVAFSAGKEWSPAEIATELKERGLLTGEFTEIYWTGPGDWHLRKI